MKKKRIAYLSSPFVADSDMPLLQALQGLTDLDYILLLQQKHKNRMLVNVGRLKSRGGLYPMTDYPDLQNLGNFINLGKAYVLNMPGRHDWSPSNLLAVLSLLWFLLRHRYDVVHITWPLRYGLFPLYLLRKRMVLTVHDPLPHSSEDTLLNRLHRWMAMKLVPRFILLNHYQRQEFIGKYHLRDSQVCESQLGSYNYLADLPPVYPESKDYVLFVGSINTHKGVDVLCQAMQNLHAAHPGLKLIVAGSGRMYFDARPYMESGVLELHNRYLTDGELAGFIRQARFVVCPYVDATQSGIVMSAFALGKPVIATRVGGLPEMVVDRRYGLLVPPKDAGALAEAIETLVDAPDLLGQMSSHIIEDYGSGHRSWQYIAEEMVKNYR